VSAFNSTTSYFSSLAESEHRDATRYRYTTDGRTPGPSPRVLVCTSTCPLSLSLFSSLLLHARTDVPCPPGSIARPRESPSALARARIALPLHSFASIPLVLLNYPLIARLLYDFTQHDRREIRDRADTRLASPRLTWAAWKRVESSRYLRDGAPRGDKSRARVSIVGGARGYNGAPFPFAAPSSMAHGGRC